MARQEIVIGSAAGVRLIEVIHRVSGRVFSRYVVTTLHGPSRRDFVSLRSARQAFDEEAAASRLLKGGPKSRTRTHSMVGNRPTASDTGAGGLDGQS